MDFNLSDVLLFIFILLIAIIAHLVHEFIRDKRETK